jgi:c-di-GMP-binding flagellar brake protein YcgR
MEKRQFYRFLTCRDIQFRLLDPETIEVISQPFPGILRDLSGGGLCFTTEENLKEGQLLEIKLVIDDQVLNLIGKVLRKINRDDIVFYAAEFMYLDSKTQDQLVQLIFKLEGKGRK